MHPFLQPALQIIGLALIITRQNPFNFIFINIDMWNLWGYLSKQGNEGSEGSREPPELKINYAHVQELFRKVQQLQGVNIFAYPTSQLASTFEDVMGTLHGLLNVITELKHEHFQLEKQLSDYKHIKDLLSQHTQMIIDLEQRNSAALNKVFKEKTAMEERLSRQISSMTDGLSELSRQLKSAQQKVHELQFQNQNLKEAIDEKVQLIMAREETIQNYESEIQNLLAVRSRQSKQEVPQINRINLEVVFYYSKIRRQIYQFLEVKDYELLGQTSKRMLYVSRQDFKREYLPILLQQQNKKNKEAAQKVDNFTKLFDEFPAENIKTNALRYLYFKTKPGSYLLPYFQEESKDLRPGAKEDKGRTKWPQLSLWKKKEDPDEQSSKDANSTLAQLKDEGEFNQVQKDIEIFFDRIFGIQMPDDLRNLAIVMQKEMNELKQSLKHYNKSLQVLCLSKFLFLESNELNNLLQVCFSLLLNANFELKELRKKHNDVVDNERVLRDLVDSIACDRGNVEKRVWFLENESINYKSQLSKILPKIDQAERQNQLLSRTVEKIEGQASTLRTALEKEKKQRKRLQSRLKEASEILSSTQLLTFE